MPPKKAAGGPSKKTEQKKKEKVIEDKTFGLKNKKGNKQQKYINNVTQQVKCGNQKAAKVAENPKLARKDMKKKEQDELNMLFRPVMEAQKIAKGVDPKSVLCAFFKQGSCTKGDKCKFSHDLNIGRKAEKRSMYTDVREDDDLAKDTMDNWDEEKLQEVVNKKHGDANDNKTKTDIVCKFFIQALEGMKYGWFWSCPNGEKCKYRHALPPGFVLKREKKKMEEQEEDKLSLEELIEEERARLTGNLTRINLETFMQWKKRKIAEKRRKREEDQNKKKNELKQGKSLGVTGRELFQFKPEMVGDDDDEGDVFSYAREVEEDDTVKVKEVSIEAFAALAMEVDTSANISNRLPDHSAPAAPGNKQDDEAGKLDQAAAINPDKAPTIGAEGGACSNGDVLLDDVDIDEDLFGADIDNELEDLDLED